MAIGNISIAPSGLNNYGSHYPQARRLAWGYHLSAPKRGSLSGYVPSKVPDFRVVFRDLIRSSLETRFFRENHDYDVRERDLVIDRAKATTEIRRTLR